MRLRVLDLDLENRPLSYLGKDYTTADITALAASFDGEPTIHLWLLGVRGGVWRWADYRRMLHQFRVLYDEADVVTGHYLRKHDLPFLNWAMIEAGLPKLAPKTSIDTYLDCSEGHYTSKSQENLAPLLGVKENKVHMTQFDWREANRLLPAGLEKVKKRVLGDVKQHKAIRREMARRGLLSAPKTWRP